MSTLKVESIPLAEIKPYWRNPRNNAAAVKAVKQSIEDYGFNVPILVDKERVIIAGHTRYKALLELDHTHVPCIVLDLPAAKAKEFRLVDNKTNELADWDLNNLTVELREIEGLKDMQIYFPDMDLGKLLGDMANFEFPGQKEIEKQKQVIESEHEGRGAEAQGDYVDLVCPGCGEGFSVGRVEIERIMARNKGKKS